MSHMPTLIEPIVAVTDKSVSVAISATRPTTSADGVSVASWRLNGYAPPLAAIWIEGSATATITSPTGGSSGVELWGYITLWAKWYLITELRDGRDISVTTAQGYTQAGNAIGVFDRLAVAGTASAGTGTARFAPMETY